MFLIFPALISLIKICLAAALTKPSSYNLDIDCCDAPRSFNTSVRVTFSPVTFSSSLPFCLSCSTFDSSAVIPEETFSFCIKPESSSLFFNLLKFPSNTNRSASFIFATSGISCFISSYAFCAAASEAASIFNSFERYF